MDDDQLELAQRRLQEAVKTKVEADLFRYYRNVGSIIIAVLGAVGIAFGWPAMQSFSRKDFFRRSLKKSQSRLKEAKAATQEALKRAREAEQAAEQAKFRRCSVERGYWTSQTSVIQDVLVNLGSAKEQLDAFTDKISELESASPISTNSRSAIQSAGANWKA